MPINCKAVEHLNEIKKSITKIELPTITLTVKKSRKIPAKINYNKVGKKSLGTIYYLVLYGPADFSKAIYHKARQSEFNVRRRMWGLEKKWQQQRRINKIKRIHELQKLRETKWTKEWFQDKIEFTREYPQFEHVSELLTGPCTVLPSHINYGEYTKKRAPQCIICHSKLPVLICPKHTGGNDVGTLYISYQRGYPRVGRNCREKECSCFNFNALNELLGKLDYKGECTFKIPKYFDAVCSSSRCRAPFFWFINKRQRKFKGVSYFSLPWESKSLFILTVYLNYLIDEGRRKNNEQGKRAEVPPSRGRAADDKNKCGVEECSI